jgi:hypothetical protein
MDAEKERKRRASGISGGIFLICLGILLYTGWWWPGIMFAIGLAGGAELVFRGKVARGLGTLAFFCAIPIVVWVIQETKIPWSLVIPMVLIGIGVTALVKSLYLREDHA